TRVQGFAGKCGEGSGECVGRQESGGGVGIVELQVMARNRVNSIIFVFLTCCGFVYANGLARNLPVLSFDEGYSQLFGDDNMIVLKDGKSVHLSLDERTGSGFVSQDLYLHGYFSASIKLPADYTAGVVVAFYFYLYVSSAFISGGFYVDDVAIREIKRTESMGADFPSKPMTLYATIWDASEWATNGGKYKVNYKYAPYIAEFSNFVLHGCTVDPIELSSIKCETGPSSNSIPTGITPSQRTKMESFRKKHMQYSYCYDKRRYKTPPSECVLNPKEAERLKRFDPVTFGSGRGRHHGKRHRRSEVASI
nr:probable xyloglucan endotransglucosylase/hydrolase protein 28 [Tanacetum cinerariifolium]